VGVSRAVIGIALGGLFFSSMAMASSYEDQVRQALVARVLSDYSFVASKDVQVLFLQPTTVPSVPGQSLVVVNLPSDKKIVGKTVVEMEAFSAAGGPRSAHARARR